MNKALKSLILSGLPAFLIFLSSSCIFAASCPCCGQEYGSAAPGDQARVDGLRRQHEAQCCGNRGGGGGYSGAGPAESFATGFVGGMVQSGAQAIGQSIANTIFNPRPSQPQSPLPISESESYYNQAFSMEFTNKEEALKMYEEGARRFPEKADLFRDRAIYVRNGGKYDKGKEYEDRHDWESAIKWYEDEAGKGGSEAQYYREQAELARQLQKEDVYASQRVQSKVSGQKVQQALDGLNKEIAKPKGDAPDLDFVGSTVDLSQAKSHTPRIEQVKSGLASVSYPECGPGLDCAARTELVLEALQKEKTWEDSAAYLERQARERGGLTPAYEQAISYIQGFQCYEELNPEDVKPQGQRQDLLDVLVSNPDQWPGEKRPGTNKHSSMTGGATSYNPANWKLMRTEKLQEALNKNKSDMEKTEAYLVKKVKDNPKDRDSVNALNFLRGFKGYAEFEIDKK